MNEHSSGNLESWVNRLNEHDMPIFGHTVQSIVAVAKDDDAPASELARVVLQDASLTTRVLKLANTIYYNPREQGISTVSRAVVVLGFNTVHNMCLSIALVDSLVQGTHRDRLNKELARSIHAAVQARTIAIERGDPSPEEVFIATLLFRLGELAFWCFSGDQGEELDAVMDQPGYTDESAQDQVLGFRLKTLTSNLAAEWKLNDLLVTTLKDPKSAGKRGQNVVLTHKLAETAEIYGWNAPETKEIAHQLAKMSDKPVSEMRSLLHHNAREAVHIASLFGSNQAAKSIPQPGNRHESDDAVEELVVEDIKRYPEPDGMLQLKILRELSMLLEKSGDFNLVMELVLEGMYRGIGLDRTLFALLTPDKKGIRAKYALGEKSEQLTNRFHFTRTQRANIFFELLDKQSCLLADVKKNPQLESVITDSVTGVIGKIPFLVCPIVINNRAIGLFYADRGLSGRELDEESYESFKHFAKQANMGLSLLTSRRK